MATTETDQLKDTIELMEIDVTFHKERAERFQAENKILAVGLKEQSDMVELLRGSLASLKAVLGQVKEWHRKGLRRHVSRKTGDTAIGSGEFNDLNIILSTVQKPLAQGKGFVMPHGVGAAKERQSSFSISTCKTNNQQLDVYFIVLPLEGERDG